MSEEEQNYKSILSTSQQGDEASRSHKKMAQRVIFHIVLKVAAKKEFCVESIKRIDEDSKYVFPAELQSIQNHPELYSLSSVKNVFKALNKIGQYRNLRVTLNDELSSVYMDSDSNFVFKEHYLEESIPIEERATLSGEASAVPQGLEELIKSLKIEKNVQKLNSVEKKFSLQKFDGNQKAILWLTAFEQECERFEIVEDEEKVNCLKLFLVGRALDWYQSNLIKLPQDDWSQWESSFSKVFAEKGWAKVRYAHRFKYFTGSIVEYALKKERLLLEAEGNMNSITRVNQIVMGLPEYIQDKLDREKIEDTDDLFNMLGQYDTAKMRHQKEVSGYNTSEKKFTVKKI